MKILIACEFSGIVRECFTSRGHDAWSCDLLDTDREGNHIKGDVLDILEDGWDMMIAHPPCTFLAVTGNRWMNHPLYPNREKDREGAKDFFMKLALSGIEKIAIENPVGVMSTAWRKPDQYIQPYLFGEPHSKKTGLWLKNLPKLKPTKTVEPEMYTYKSGKKDPMWHVKTLNLPQDARAKARSRTFQGIAEAMAEQWS
jgi:hypothetical protein